MSINSLIRERQSMSLTCTDDMQIGRNEIFICRYKRGPTAWQHRGIRGSSRLCWGKHDQAQCRNQLLSIETSVNLSQLTSWRIAEGLGTAKNTSPAGDRSLLIPAGTRFSRHAHHWLMEQTGFKHPCSRTHRFRWLLYKAVPSAVCTPDAWRVV